MRIIKVITNLLINPKSALRYIFLKRVNKNLKIKFINIYKIDKYLKNKLLFEPQYYDLENLINLIKIIKPKYVLELGGGFSTIAICYALQYNYEKHGIKGKLISYDQSKYYLNLTKKIIPEKLSKYVKFQYSQLKLIKYKGLRVSIFKNILEKNYNLIYEDRFDHKKTRIGADIIFLEKKMKSNCSFVVDGHKYIVEFLKKNLKKKYEIENSKIFFRTNFVNYNHINERKI